MFPRRSYPRTEANKQLILHLNNWEQIENKLGTNYQRTAVNQVDQHMRKSLRSKDGLVFCPAHNPKVVSSNLTPATISYKAGIQDSGLFRSRTRGKFVVSYRHITTDRNPVESRRLEKLIERKSLPHAPAKIEDGRQRHHP